MEKRERENMNQTYMPLEIKIHINSISVTQSCPTLCDPMDIRPPCPSPTPGVYSNSCPLSWWCHPIISSSVIPFSSRLQSFPASGFFPMSQFFASGGQSTGVSSSKSPSIKVLWGWGGGKSNLNLIEERHKDWENVTIHHGDELSKIQTMRNSKGQKTQFLQQIQGKGEKREGGERKVKENLCVNTAICRLIQLD